MSPAPSTIIISSNGVAIMANPPRACGCGHVVALFLNRGGRTGCAHCMPADPQVKP